MGIGDWAQSPIPNPQNINKGSYFLPKKLYKQFSLKINIYKNVTTEYNINKNSTNV